MKKNVSQRGNTNVVIVIVLVAIVLVALGFVFYKNFVANKTDDEKPQVQDSSVKPNEPAEVKQVELKEFCTEAEGLCFKYPVDWTVESSVDYSAEKTIGFSADRVTIKNKSGKPYLYIRTGISGIGGACLEDESKYTTIVEAHTTKITGNFVQEQSPDYLGDTVYAVKYIGEDKVQPGKYQSGMFMTATKKATIPGKVYVCDVGYQMFYSKRVASSVEFSTSSDSRGMAENTFDSYDEAKKGLSTPDSLAAYEILKSAYYK
jgi:hypothetical protein